MFQKLFFFILFPFPHWVPLYWFCSTKVPITHFSNKKKNSEEFFIFLYKKQDLWLTFIPQTVTECTKNLEIAKLPTITTVSGYQFY